MERNIVYKYITYGWIVFTIFLTTLRSSITYTDEMMYLGGLCCLFIIFISFIKKHKTIHLSYSDIIVLLWCVYTLIQGYIESSAHCGSIMASCTLLTSLYICFRKIFSNEFSKLKDYEITLIIIVATYIELCIGIFQIYRGTSFHEGQLITGSFFNSGPYSAFLMMGMVAAICFLHFKYHTFFPKHIRKIIKMMCIILLVLGASAFGVTMSRAAIITFTGITLYIFYDKYKTYRKLCFSLFVLLSIICIVLIYIKYPSAIGRVIVWYFCLKLFFSNFIFGVGLGNFQKSYAQMMCDINQKSNHSTFVNYYAQIDYSYCDILQIGTEQGMIGFVFCVILFSILLIGLHRKSHILFFTCLSLIIFSLSSYIFHLLPFQIIITVLMAWNVNTDRIHIHISKINMYTLYVAGLLINLLTTKIIYYKVCGINEFLKYNGSGFSIKEYKNLYSSCQEIPNYYINYAEALRKEHRYLDSNAILREGLNVSGDPNLYNMIGDNYKDMEFYTEALKSYQKAFYMLPNRLTPLFSIMKLYKIIGDKNQAQKYAIKVCLFHPKVSSYITREMKDEAYNELNKN